MKLYLAGPMTGYPEFNFPAFAAESARLRTLGFEVVNPAELNSGSDGDWLACMRVDIKALVDCDGVALLPGWEKSRGAPIEQGLARDLGLCVHTSAHIIDLIAGMVVLSDKALVELLAAA
ncbi:DUF4406 domain-containing protein [Caballeronia sp. dw_19]|uniref:DUF4406 domain-containing protein n=1 Tax=Caballeronia sp. dw_19 TaxID=2719791 RepID=UPI001BCC882A|nr:DUF4406 domain-containing protein [Caballeronia sp. dw_19]